MTPILHDCLETLMTHYKGRKHPLAYTNIYQLVVMVILSAQDSDQHINKLMPEFFNTYPDMSTLASANPESLHPFLHTVRNFANKSNWLIRLAQIVQTDNRIPNSMLALIQLPGIGRKSANVILRESGAKAEGIIVDLHVVRVAPRIGIATGNQPEKIERALMRITAPEIWAELGMSLSFLGRELCRPSRPQCHICPMNRACKHLNGPAQIIEYPTLF